MIIGQDNEGVMNQAVTTPGPFPSNYLLIHLQVIDAAFPVQINAVPVGLDKSTGNRLRNRHLQLKGFHEDSPLALPFEFLDDCVFEVEEGTGVMVAEDDVVVMGFAVTAPGPFPKSHLGVYFLVEATGSAHLDACDAADDFGVDEGAGKFVWRVNLQLERFNVDLPLT